MFGTLRTISCPLECWPKATSLRSTPVALASRAPSRFVIATSDRQAFRVLLTPFGRYPPRRLLNQRLVLVRYKLAGEIAEFLKMGLGFVSHLASLPKSRHMMGRRHNGRRASEKVDFYYNAVTVRARSKSGSCARASSSRGPRIETVAVRDTGYRRHAREHFDPFPRCSGRRPEYPLFYRAAHNGQRAEEGMGKE